ncbi:uncharacterized protein B0J16DRAFT_366531 [Fusarium flagelliforme]|uniref:uncharacterized protein n=1 Tax=Fusarium flagelliforme TaxID=2675880 RepID=UPI001E8D179A|nr:uncharacterized protein B0J16DRAFT_366531 [Fusarium flagelliforme]KAH7197305.1 hypothetical protein B0J16DRAFT_366531 [Fusarium flagelliforme]
MKETAPSPSPPVEPGRGRRVDRSEPPRPELDPADEPSQASGVRGSRDYREAIDLTDDRSRSPNFRKSRDHRGRGQGRRERVREPVTPEVLARLNGVAYDRQPYTPIRAHHQLVAEEKQKLDDWLCRSSMVTDPNICVTNEDFRRYLDAIFEDCVSFDHEMDGSIFIQKDCNGSKVPYDIISFTPGFHRVEVHDQAIAEYDHHELQRIRRHNTAIIVACARRAIKTWAQRGTEPGPDLDVREPRGLRISVFARDRVVSAGEALVEVGRRLIRESVLPAPRAPYIAYDIG